VSESSQRPSNPVFVVGVFRSGTSLLYSLLNLHPQVALMYECDVWDFPNLAGRRRFSANWLERQEFYNQVLSRHRLIFGGKLNGLEKIQTPADLYRCHGDSKDARLWGEKSPVYATRLAQLARQYPHGSFILIWRDPVEVYRSVLRAGKKTAFFRRPGMLHRLIFHQEKMIREAGELQTAGARIHHISYDDLVDRTEATCRATCDFLGVAFHAEMLDLKHADFSAIYREPQHEFLRRGVIERQNFSEAAVLPGEAAKLRRFCRRWERLSGQRLAGSSAGAAEPAAAERAYHRCIGGFFFAAENAKRLAFEFLPLPWLRNYRLFKDWIFGGAAQAEHRSLRQQLAEHWLTIGISLGLLAGVGIVDHFTGPEISLAAFYALPVMALTVIVGRGWGSFVALLAAGTWSALQTDHHNWDASSEAVLLWNTFMRFAVLQVIVFLLDRIRRELAARSRKS
jgi:hypothetical protein